jgi:integrase
VNGYLRLLKTVMGDAVAEHRLPRDPTARIRAIPERRRAELESDEPVNLLSSEELGTFLAVLKARHPQWYALVFTQFATARRFGEVSALRWEDIDWDRGRIRVRRAQWRTIIDTPKTDRAVTVPLTDEHREVLTSWRKELLRTQHRHIHTGWVFPSRAGKPHHNASCMRKAFVDVLRKMKLERRFSSHGLRRTANDLLRRVATGEVTRAITGHVTAAMTEHYSHVDAAEKKAAVEGMLRLIQSATLPGEPNRHIDRHTEGETGTNRNGRSGNRP